MTQDKARKDAIRDRMARTGEKYNVARRTMEAASEPASHLITDDETRCIAESFLAASPWYGDVQWKNDIVIGPMAEWLRDLDGNYAADAELSEGQRWSWSVTFVDPSGETKQLTHDHVLLGLHRLVYGDDKETGVGGIRLLSLRQWFTEPAAERRKLKLSTSDTSRICQQALYDRLLFDTEDESISGKLDFFSDQRPAQDDPEDLS